MENEKTREKWIKENISDEELKTSWDNNPDNVPVGILKAFSSVSNSVGAPRVTKVMTFKKSKKNENKDSK